jgi:hypothetical protein
VSKLAVANFVQALVAVLAGNVLYFLLVPHLPPPARHVPPRVDLGMLVDFWICLVIFGAIKTVAGRKGKANSDSARRHP